MSVYYLGPVASRLIDSQESGQSASSGRGSGRWAKETNRLKEFKKRKRGKQVMGMPGPEQVLTVEYYWDGPKTGVATFKGEPHAYECVFDDRLDMWSWFYLLKPIDPRTLQLVMEKWQIWLRWEDAHQTGRTTIGTHPALPADRPRRLELEKILNSRLDVQASSNLAAHAEFERFGPPGASGPWEVMWTTIDRVSLGHIARVGSVLRSPDIDPDLYQRRFD